ncbi:MAG TPA: DUF2851 family protein [Flavobacterium sp.]
MKEDFLHYVWRYKKFNLLNLQSTSGELITIISTGHYIQQAGPDFFDARMIIGGQKWAGNVEIHLKSSDWYIHHHESDSAYDTVILHVVWDHDMEIYQKNNIAVTTLELKHYVAADCLQKYSSLTTPKSWIYCERDLASVTHFTIRSWQEKMLVERLIRKSEAIEILLNESASDWEAVMFYLLAKNFGLNTNGELFFKLAQRIPFSAIRKERGEVANIEALLFGLIGSLQNCEDVYQNDLLKRWIYLKEKYQLDDSHVGTIQFFKHRPDNFPTIRLAQLAALYHLHQNLFAEVINCSLPIGFYAIFKIEVSEYWLTHYQFGKVSRASKKQLSPSFIQLLIINTIIPMKFAYEKSRGTNAEQQLIELMMMLPSENNSIIDKFRSFGVAAENAFDSQALLQLKNEYCNFGRCMQCAIGSELMQPQKAKNDVIL